MFQSPPHFPDHAFVAIGADASRRIAYVAERGDPAPIAVGADDLALAADVLNAPSEGRNLRYVGGFLLGIGRCADDAELGDAALRLIRAEEESAEARQRAETLAAMVQDRLAQTRVAI